MAVNGMSFNSEAVISPWAQGGGAILAEQNSISYLFRESWNLGNFIDVLLLSKSADARAYSAGMTYILVVQVHSEDLMIQEKSHDSRFFCVLRSLGITCK